MNGDLSFFLPGEGDKQGREIDIFDLLQLANIPYYSTTLNNAIVSSHVWDLICLIPALSDNGKNEVDIISFLKNAYEGYKASKAESMIDVPAP